MLKCYIAVWPVIKCNLEMLTSKLKEICYYKEACQYFKNVVEIIEEIYKKEYN